jgi:uncharacterized protein (DUF1810 family)
MRLPLPNSDEGRSKATGCGLSFPSFGDWGLSPTSQYYGIASFDEARAYLQHPVLGSRLHECVAAILPWSRRFSAEQILGQVDALKFQSSLTLFDVAEPGGLFAAALAEFHAGEADERTLALLNGAQ